MTLCAFYTFYKAVQSNQTRFLDHDALDIKIENNFDEAYSYYEEFLKTIDADSKFPTWATWLTSLGLSIPFIF